MELEYTNKSIDQDCQDGVVIFDSEDFTLLTKFAGGWYKIQDRNIYEELSQFGISLVKLQEMLDDWEKQKYPERFI